MGNYMILYTCVTTAWAIFAMLQDKSAWLSSCASFELMLLLGHHGPNARVYILGAASETLLPFMASGFAAASSENLSGGVCWTHVRAINTMVLARRS